MKYIIVWGDGLKNPYSFIGPFKDYEHAKRYKEKYEKESHFTIMSLHEPCFLIAKELQDRARKNSNEN